MSKIKVDKPVASQLYRPLMGYTSKHGTFSTEARLRGDQAAVLGHPEYWIPDGIADAEEAAAFEARFGAAARRFSPGKVK